MAQFIASVHGQGIVTLDYGDGSPQEAAALLSYLDAPTTSNVPIGYGEECELVRLFHHLVGTGQLSELRLLGLPAAPPHRSPRTTA